LAHDPAPTTSARVRLNWRTAGEGPNALVLLHGFPFNSAMWEPQLDAVPAGWRFIAPDLRGFGSSTGGGEGAYTMDVYARDTARLLDHLKVERAVICGLSMGGYVAFAFWRLFRPRVRGLVLANTRAGADTESARKGRHELIKRVEQEGARAVRDAMLPKLFSPFTRRRHPELVEQIGAMIDVAPADSLRRALLGMAERPNSEPVLTTIDVPMLVLVGEDDEIIAAGEGQLMARPVRGSVIERIPDAGHLTNLERPDLFNAALNHFLEFSFGPG
jgi:3-oxoadipate enol-lactonase